MAEEILTLEDMYRKEHWDGSSKDGILIDGDGYHFFRMQRPGKIVEAYEFYESDDGQEVVTRLIEMEGVDWIEDLGFEDLEVLDTIKEIEFIYIKQLFADGQ